VSFESISDVLLDSGSLLFQIQASTLELLNYLLGPEKAFSKGESHSNEIPGTASL
jgi:hypothetical protein